MSAAHAQGPHPVPPLPSLPSQPQLDSPPLPQAQLPVPSPTLSFVWPTPIHDQLEANIPTAKALLLALRCEDPTVEGFDYREHRVPRKHAAALAQLLETVKDQETILRVEASEGKAWKMIKTEEVKGMIEKLGVVVVVLESHRLWGCSDENIIGIYTPSPPNRIAFRVAAGTWDEDVPA